ncbi:hypothetical protein LCGC14_2919790 [marine sediment metagenome]|uniref:HK97 gp10 family phage protein n=1 Tax=marine sediment metagenome TaxID=412755 RepID=A0A0F8ZWR8_9ZZZZ
MTLGQFKLRMERRAKDVEPRLNSILQKAALAIQQKLAELTPKKTGFAAVNWQISTRARPTGTIPAPGKERAVLTAMAQGKMALVGSKAVKRIYITNNVHYIRLLNQGSSHQHPGGFVEISLLVAKRFFATGRIIAR